MKIQETKKRIYTLLNSRRFNKIIELLKHDPMIFVYQDVALLLALAYDQQALLEFGSKRKKMQDGAIMLLKKMLIKNGHKKEILMGLGRVYLHKHDFLRSLSFYKEILKKYGRSEDAFVGLGNNYFALKKYRLAEKYYKEALKTNKRSSVNWSNLAHTYKAINDYKKSDKYLQGAIDILRKKRARKTNRALDDFLSYLVQQKAELQHGTQ